jgi:hypothetical protein
MEPEPMNDNPLGTPEIAAVDKLRGHRFQPPQDVLRRIPALYAEDDVPFDDKVVWLHYFGWITEYDPESGLAFGYADLGFGFGEWGSVDLVEMAVITRAPMIPIERDMYFTPKPAGQIREIR